VFPPTGYQYQGCHPGGGEGPPYPSWSGGRGKKNSKRGEKRKRTCNKGQKGKKKDQRKGEEKKKIRRKKAKREALADHRTTSRKQDQIRYLKKEEPILAVS